MSPKCRAHLICKTSLTSYNWPLWLSCCWLISLFAPDIVTSAEFFNSSISMMLSSAGLCSSVTSKFVSKAALSYAGCKIPAETQNIIGGKWADSKTTRYKCILSSCYSRILIYDLFQMDWCQWSCYKSGKIIHDPFLEEDICWWYLHIEGYHQSTTLNSGWDEWSSRVCKEGICYLV